MRGHSQNEGALITLYKIIVRLCIKEYVKHMHSVFRFRSHPYILLCICKYTRRIWNLKYALSQAFQKRDTQPVQETKKQVSSTDLANNSKLKSSEGSQLPFKFPSSYSYWGYSSQRNLTRCNFPVNQWSRTGLSASWSPLCPVRALWFWSSCSPFEPCKLAFDWMLSFDDFPVSM